MICGQCGKTIADNIPPDYRTAQECVCAQRIEELAGICQICGCTELDPCYVQARSGAMPVPCSWADETRTLCTNPDCLEIAIDSCEACPIPLSRHTPLMLGGCAMRILPGIPGFTVRAN